MKSVIFKAGDQGFIYVDLLAALIILSLTLTVLFSSSRSLLAAQKREAQQFQTSLEIYETKLLEQIQR